MIRGLTLAVLCLPLCGCMMNVRTNEEPYIIEGPTDAAIYIQGYRKEEIFYGNEASVAFPFLGPIPVIGTFLSGKLISLRSGAVRPIFIPEYREKTYATQQHGGPRTASRLSVPFRMQQHQLQGSGVCGR